MPAVTSGWRKTTSGARSGVTRAMGAWKYTISFPRRLSRASSGACPWADSAAEILLDQVIGTALLMLLVLALTDERNQPVSGNLVPVLIGLVVVVIGISFGALHGYAINPARDLGPRLMIVLAGFKNNGLTDGTWRFWVPIVAPLVGGVIGSVVYDQGIRRYLSEN